MTAQEPSFDVLADPAGPPRTLAEQIYGAELRFPSGEPRVVANFVSTIDGVVSLGLPDGTDSSTVSGHHTGDRYVMAMLRAAADAVMVGAGTLRASVGHQWTPAGVRPAHLEAILDYRRDLGHASATAPLVVVTGSGMLPAHVALAQPEAKVLIVTTARGRDAVRAAYPALRVAVAGNGAHVDGEQLLAVLREKLGARLVLCEGGPSLLGTLFAAGHVDELFLTIAPWIAGRDASHPRLALVNDFVAPPGGLRPMALRSARRSGDHLLLRYALER